MFFCSSMEIGELDQRLKQAQQQLKNLESARSNKMRRFGQHMPELLRRIDDAHKQGQFHRKPLGPLGEAAKQMSLAHKFWSL